MNNREQKIVQMIFGGERCVTTLADLEAIALAIHPKALHERDNPFAEKPERKTWPKNDFSDEGRTAKTLPLWTG
jgi:hypothetical protein